MDKETARQLAHNFANLLVEVDELKTGFSIWVWMGNRKTRVMRIPLEYPDHVVVPKSIYTPEMGPIEGRGRTTDSMIIGL